MKFKDLIGNIEKRPRGYLRNESVTELYVLLLGFSRQIKTTNIQELIVR